MYILDKHVLSFSMNCLYTYFILHQQTLLRWVEHYKNSLLSKVE